MAPVSEASILSSYLLSSIDLPSFLTLQQFTALFPARDRTTKERQIRSLYRDLQHQRMTLSRKITANIERELQTAKQMRQTMVETRAQMRGPDVQAGSSYADTMDTIELFSGAGGIGDGPARGDLNMDSQKHSCESLTAALEEASGFLESDFKAEEQRSAQLLAEIQGITSGLSDLRYGKMTHPSAESVVQSVVEGLCELQASCEPAPRERPDG